MRYQFKPNGERYSEGDREPRYVHWSKRWEKVQKDIEIPTGEGEPVRVIKAGTVLYGDSHTFHEGRNVEKRKYGRGNARKHLRREVNRLERLADLVDSDVRELDAYTA